MATTETHKSKREGDRARSTMTIACRKFLQKCGGQTTNPLLFQTLAEVALKDFQLQFDGPVKLDDVCFIRIGNKDAKLENVLHKHGDKKKYEQQPPVVVDEHKAEG